MKRMHRPAALALAITCVTGCATITNQQTTELQYVPADGSIARLPGVGVFSAMLLATGPDEPGTLIARIVNSTSEPQSVSLTGTGAAVFDEQFVVEPRSTLDIGPDGEELVVEPAGEQPGKLVPVTVSTSEGTVDITVPVLDDTFEKYADLIPTGGPQVEAAPTG